jgi:hypothetical protein
MGRIRPFISFHAVRRLDWQILLAIRVRIVSAPTL